LSKNKHNESGARIGVEKEIQPYLIKEHKFISKWILGPFLLEVRDSELHLSPKYSMGNIDYDDPDGLIKDFQYFYTNSISVLEKREVKLSVYAFISPVIYFKWCDDDQLIWGLDSRFFQYDEIASLLSYKEADKYVDPHSILHGILKKHEKIRNERNADSQTVLFFLYLWCYFNRDAEAVILQFKHETGFFYHLRSQDNFHDVVVRLLFTRRILNLSKDDNQKLTQDFIELDVRKDVPIDEHLLLKKRLEDAIHFKPDWQFGDLLDLAIFCHKSFGPGKQFPTFRDACKAAAQQWCIDGREITYNKIEKRWENYYQQTKST